MEQEKKMDKKKSANNKKSKGWVFGDLNSIVFNMGRIFQSEEIMMQSAAFFDRILSTKRDKIEFARRIISFVKQRLDDGKEKDVRALISFLNRCLGCDGKRNLAEAIEKVDQEFKAKMVDLGFVESYYDRL